MNTQIHNKKILFVGGGSGGHLSIIKALIDALRESNYPVQTDVVVVGGKLGMIGDNGGSIDEKIIETFGVPYRLIRGGKLHRGLRNGFSIAQLQTTMRLLWAFWGGFMDAYKVLKEFRPSVIFSAGGYVSLPVVIVGKLMGIKVVIHEQTMVAGIANKISGYFADQILLTFEQSAKNFQRAKTRVVGNVIRREVLESNPVDNEIIDLVEKSNNLPIIYITGGSLGAHKINIFIEQNLEVLLRKFRIIWQTGDNKYHNDFERISKLLSTLDPNLRCNIVVRNYIYSDIGYVIKYADIVVARPGANTVYELAVLGKRAILIPLWVTSKSDQYKNAEWFVSNFDGCIIQESDLKIEDFVNHVAQLLNRYVDCKLGYVDSTNKILEIVLN